MNPRTTAAELSKATSDQKPAAHLRTSATPHGGAVASHSAAEEIKNAFTLIASTPPTDATLNVRKLCNASLAVKAEKNLKAITEMELHLPPTWACPDRKI